MQAKKMVKDTPTPISNTLFFSSFLKSKMSL